MKTFLFLILLICSFCKFTLAQIICIKCYDQNDSISSNVNNLILNGGFENGCPSNHYFCPNSQYYDCDITNWICTGGASGTYARIVSLNLVEGTHAAYFGNFFCKACSVTPSDISCLRDSLCMVNGIPNGYPNNDTAYGGANGVSLEQTVNGLTVGNTYVLEFWVGGGDGFDLKGVFAIDIGFGTTFLRVPSLAASGLIGTTYIIEFSAIFSSHTIKFTNWGHICDDCEELGLDNVRLYTLSELSSLIPSCITGINDYETNNTFSIYFSNTTDEFVGATNNSQSSEIIIYDITFRKLLQQKFTNSIRLNVTEFPNGIYLYEFRNKNETIKNGKVVKQ